MAYAICGFAALVIALPIAAAFLRNDPRDKGLLPDGIVEAVGVGQPVASKNASVEGLTWHEIWHSPTRSGYWFLHSFSRMRAYMPACYIFPRC